MKKWYMVICCLMPGLTLCSCAGKNDKNEVEPSAEDLVVVGFSQLGSESDWRVANTESMKHTFAEENGYELMFDDARQKLENQIAAIRNYILQGVDYIAVAPVIEVGWEEVLQEAKDAGIPVIVLDRMIKVEDESLYTAWVGSDCRKEADMAMEWLEETLEAQGRADEEISIVHVMGTLGSTAQLGRTEGLEAGVAEHENWKIVAQVEGEFIQAQAYEEMQELLKTDMDIDVLYCENDNSAYGAMQALDEKGITYGVDGDVIVISFDATRAGLQACLAGEMNLNVECNPLQGPLVEQIISQLEAGETPQKHQYVEEIYFTQETLSEEFINNREY